MRLFTALYSGAPMLFFSSPPPFRRLQVCVHSSEEMCWLVYKGSDIKMDQEILVPFYTASLPLTWQ